MPGMEVQGAYWLSAPIVTELLRQSGPHDGGLKLDSYLYGLGVDLLSAPPLEFLIDLSLELGPVVIDVKLYP